MVMMRLRLLLLCLITPMFGLMVAFFWIGSLVFLLLVLVSFLILLKIAGVVIGGRHIDRVCLDGLVHSCRGFCFVPGPLQSIQRAEM